MARRPPVKTPAQRKDPYLSFQFVIKVDGMDVAGFSEVTGLELETAVEQFREGGQRLYEQQLAGVSKFPSRIVLKRGMTSRALWSWHQDVVQGRIQRKKVVIELRDTVNNRVESWSFHQAAPVKWIGPQLRAANADVAVETLELVHNGLVPDNAGR